MIIFLHGEDAHRAREKLNEIIAQYKKVHKSGLNLIWADAGEKDFKDIMNVFKMVSMFAEKKLVILKNVFENKKFQEEFLEDIEKLNDAKDVIVVYSPGEIDGRSKLLKVLKKEAKCQEFSALAGDKLKRWAESEFAKHGAKIEPLALNVLLLNAGNNLLALSSEIKKLAHYKRGGVVKKEDVDLHVKSKIATDIFKTIDALAQKNKKEAMGFLRRHLDNGDNPLYMLSMFAFQFKNLLVVKELADKLPYQDLAKKSGLHPFVVKKTFYQCRQFSLPELKKIYQNIFLADCDIKTGKIDPELALELLISNV